ncbi:MAG: hypothetical protein AAB250_09110 [Bdellovibrionota bacterium]
MNFETSLRKTIGVVALAFTSWTIIATSQVHLDLVSGTLHVQSDCPGAARTSADVTVSGNQITAPTGYTFQDFGFPSNTVTAQPNAGTVGAIQRNCIRTVGDDTSSDDWVFTCYDGGAYACNIYLSSDR